MEKIPIVMDFIAGILLALDLFQNYGILVKIYEKIKDFIKKIDTENYTNIRTKIFSATLSGFFFILLLLGFYYKNSGNLNYNVGIEIGWFLLGAVVAWVLITLIAKILRRIGVWGIFSIGLVISILSFFFFLLHPSNEIGTALTSFVYICILYPFGMTIARTVQRILLADEKRPFYMFAVIGLLIFAVSKIYELIK